MKKAIGQTVRDLKREVNKKVLKVPSIEQKVLDETSNEPWGPHGSHLADIAQASRNYHEYQMIMSVIWKRINDTGKNWRHVYKALTVLEYLVAHGSERVIDDIREHAYQISTLSDFQYIDSSGRDQGSNVRKKSQSLVVLVNDKERIQDVRQKAAANRDKYRNTSTGGMYRPGSYSSSGGYGDKYDDDRHEGRYESRDEDRNDFGRERERAYRDDDKYGRYGDPYGRDGDHYGRDYEDRHSRDGYRDDDSRGQSQNVEDYQYGSRSRSSDKDRDQAYEYDGQYSRGNNARAEDHSQDGSSGRRLDHKFSEQNLDAPPSYKEAMSEARSPMQNERDGETSMPSAPRSLSPVVSANSNQAAAVPATTEAPAPPSAWSPTTTDGSTFSSLPPQAPSPHPASNTEVGGFDEFDPRGSFKAVPTPTPAASGGSEMDLLGSLSDSFSLNALAIVPVALATSKADGSMNSSSGSSAVTTSSASTTHNLAFDDPFGNGPFKAIPSTGSLPVQAQNVALNSSFPASANQSSELPQTLGQEFGNTLPDTTHAAPSASSLPPPSTNQQLLHQELSIPSQETDVLADILPPAETSASSVSQPSFPAAMGKSSMTGFSGQVGQQPLPGSGFPSHIGQSVSQAGFQSQTGQPVSLAGFPSQPGQAGSAVSFPVQVDQSGVQNSYPAQASQYLVGVPGQIGQPALQPGFIPQSSQPLSATTVPSQINMSETGCPASGGQPAHTNTNFYGIQLQSAAPVAPHMASQIHTGTAVQNNSTNLFPQSGSTGLVSSQIALQTTQLRPTITSTSQSGVSGSTGPLSTAPQPVKDKFETKSAIWADTLNRGLVNLNISGPKTHPLVDIGVDFDAINRKEKRMEKRTAAPITSNITMGKAMGSGSGIGRAGANALRSPPNPMMGSGMGMGLGGDPGAGIGMGGYGGNPMGGGMGMNMGMGTNMNMGVGMNMGMNQGVRMQRPAGFTPGSIMPGGYNPMLGAGGYGQQPYGGYQ